MTAADTVRTKLLADYGDELSRLPEYVDMYRKSSRLRSIPPDGVDFVTSVLDQSESLLALNRSIVPDEPGYTSVYTKTTGSGNPRPTLTAYDLKRFHGFRNQITDLVLLESARDMHAVLLHFAEHERADAFALATFGIEYGAPYVHTTERHNGREWYVIHLLFNDEAMRLKSVQETYSFLNRFIEAYPDLSHIRAEFVEGRLGRIWMDKKIVLETAEAYKDDRPVPPRTSAGFGLLGNFAFQQEGWNGMPSQMASPDAVITLLETMQLEMVPPYNRLLREGLEVLQDDRSFLPQTELAYIRELLETIIWDQVMAYFGRSSSVISRMYSLVSGKKQVDAATLKAIDEAKEASEIATRNMMRLRSEFGKIVPRLSGLRSISLGSEYMQAVEELEAAYETVSGDKSRKLKFILELDGFPGKGRIYDIPRVVGFYGMLKLLLALASQNAYKINKDQDILYFHVRFKPTVIDGESYVNVLLYNYGKEAPQEIVESVNDPLAPALPGKAAGSAQKQIQDLLAHVYKVELFQEGEIDSAGVGRLRNLMCVGNLSRRSDGLAKENGYFMEINLPAFGRPEDFKNNA
jgi:hypothetical protein